MNKQSRDRMVKIIAGSAALLMVGAVLAACGQSLPNGPVSVVWDKEACINCRMHLGDPAFAAQLQTQTGEVVFFDDPGCLFLYVDRENPPIHEIWFHHHAEDRWLNRATVGFVPHEQTPMGFGLAAVDKSADGALSFDAAHEKVCAGKDAAAAAPADAPTGDAPCPCCAHKEVADSSVPASDGAQKEGNDHASSR